MERNESYLASFYIDRDVGAGVTLKPPLDLARIRPIMTIRLRLTLWYTALLGSTLILFSVLVYSALATNLWMQVEQDAARQANEVASALEQQLELDIFIVRSNPTRVQFPDLDFFASASGVQLVGLDGLIYKRSSNLGTLNVPEYSSVLEAISRGEEVDYRVEVGNSTLFVYSVPLVVNDKVTFAVQVVKQAAPIENALRQVTRYLILGTAFSLILAALVGALLARRTLAPIDTITKTAGSITRTGDLGRRLSIVETDSEVGRLSATFNAMLDQIQQLFDTQHQLIADVSHELRTPLTSVQGNVEIMQRMARSYAASGKLPYDADSINDILAEIEDDTSRMNKMIGDLLLLAQADSGALQLQMELVEMDTLVLDVYRQAIKIAERTKGPNALAIHLGHEDQALVNGDRERLRQLLMNLMENAIKYTPAGGSISIGLENVDDKVAVSITDTGIGISPENQQRIFDRFYRTDKARSRELGGSGLGLSIVRWIAEAHNGTITVKSKLNEGSTFTVTLPRVEA